MYSVLLMTLKILFPNVFSYDLSKEYKDPRTRWMREARNQSLWQQLGGGHVQRWTPFDSYYDDNVGSVGEAYVQQ